MSESNGGSVLLRCGHLFDGTARSLQRDQAILIADGRITAVGPAAEVEQRTPPAAERIDLGEACVIPGLIDGHTHTSLLGDRQPYVVQFAASDELMVAIAAMNLRRHLLAGVTTIREHGARNMVGFTVREAVRRGYLMGPRMLVSGRPITKPGGHFHFCNETAADAEAVRQSVRRLAEQGADYIKIMASGGATEGTDPGVASYSLEELRAAALEAHRLGRRTAVHTRATEGMRRAVAAGHDLLEHAEFKEPDGEQHFDPELARAIAASNMYVSPTLQGLSAYPRIVELAARRDTGQLSEEEERELEERQQRLEARLAVFRRFLDAGIEDRIVPGTDAGVFWVEFGRIGYDLELLVQAGLAPADALRAATRTAAEAVGLSDEIGTIEAGKVADLVAVDGDPTADIGAVSRVLAVYQAGNLVT